MNESEFRVQQLALLQAQVDATNANTAAVKEQVAATAALRLPAAPVNLAAQQATDMWMKRGLDSPPHPQFHTTCTGTFAERESGEPIRFACEVVCELKPPADNPDEVRPAMWRITGVEADNLNDEDGDLYRIVRAPFEKKYAEDFRRALLDPTRQPQLDAMWARDWGFARWLRGRRVLHNMLLAKTPEQLQGLVKFAEMPPAIETATPEPAPIAAE